MDVVPGIHRAADPRSPLPMVGVPLAASPPIEIGDRVYGVEAARVPDGSAARSYCARCNTGRRHTVREAVGAKGHDLTLLIERDLGVRTPDGETEAETHRAR